MFVMKAFAPLLLCLCALPLHAQVVDCANATAQVEMTACAEQDWKAADAKLNTAYKQAMGVMKQTDQQLDPGDQGAALALRDAQRAWVTFRDATCAAEGWAYHGGSAEPMVIYACRARVTQSRADELNNMAAAD
jgi:uncharacterized protein YecT (DUF1311 family)